MIIFLKIVLAYLLLNLFVLVVLLLVERYLVERYLDLDQHESLQLKEINAFLEVFKKNLRENKDFISENNLKVKLNMASTIFA